jgi:DNA-directed RNA polymerase specialized sigma24 family protein
VNWAALTKDLTLYAFSLCKDRDMAEDVAQEALRRMIDTTSAWDPEVEPDPRRYALNCAKSIVWNERHSAAARKNVPLDPSGPDEEPDESLHPADPGAADEGRLGEVDLLTRRLAFVRRDRSGDPEALTLLDLTIEGLDAPADLAARSGLSYEAVVAARKRLRRAGQAAVEAIPDDDDVPARGGDEDDRDSAEEVA